MHIERIEEHRISSRMHEAIEHLLRGSFSDYPAGKTYFKQAPDFRFLAWSGESLVGHIAIEYRIIGLSGQTARIFGLADFCVDPDNRSQRLGSQLLEATEAWARQHQIEFLVLVASEQSVYLRHHFQAVSNRCRWLIIHQNASLGIADRQLENGLMVKPLGSREWPAGTVDFLGHLF